jgi:serine protease Do
MPGGELMSTLYRATILILFLMLSGLLVVRNGHGAPTDSIPDYVKKAEKAQEELAKKVDAYIPSFVFVQGGSGVFISEEGHFLTNYHVLSQIFKQDRSDDKPLDRVVSVETVGGTSHDALVVGVDPLGDLALCKVVDSEKSFNHLELGNSDAVSVGSYVLALGNPFLRGQFTARPIATFGVISARHVFKRAYPDALQTDAPINPGNSGGPLISLDGTLIGINGRIETRFGTRANSGVGYAISANRISRFLPVLKKGGIAFHGESMLSETEIVDREVELKHGRFEEGTLTVGEIGKNSKPYKAGLRKGDQVDSIAGYEVTSLPRLKGILQSFPAPNRVGVTYIRDGQRRQTKMELDQRGNWDKEDLLSTLPKSTNAPYLGIGMNEKNGSLTIAKVVKKSPADKAGLKKGDQLLQVNERPVPNKEAAIRMIQSRWYGETISLAIKRGNSKKTIKAQLGRREVE